MNERGFVLTVSHEPASSQVSRRPRRWNAGLALVGLGLLANAAAMVYTHVTGKAPDLVLDRAAFAQGAPGVGPAPMLGAKGLYMMPAQLGPGSFGLYLMDVDAGTICVYQAAPDQKRFGLMAVRSFRNDTLLTDFNNAPPTPHDVDLMVQQQRGRLQVQHMGNVPTVEQNPKPDENLPDVPGGTKLPVTPAATAPAAPDKGAATIAPPILPPPGESGAAGGGGDGSIVLPPR